MGLDGWELGLLGELPRPVDPTGVGAGTACGQGHPTKGHVDRMWEEGAVSEEKVGVSTLHPQTTSCL